MDLTSETKVCPHCAETIKAAAKICPYCQSRQGRFVTLTHKLSAALVGLTLLAALGFLSIWSFSDNADETRDSGFARYRDKLPVVRTVLEPVGKKPEFWLTGYVANKNGRPWRVHKLEVRFLDQHGNLVDVQHPEFNKYEAFVVQPNQEHAFRIKLDKQSHTSTGIVHSVRVQTATDGREHYDPE
jgi:hypothetical protein